MGAMSETLKDLEEIREIAALFESQDKKTNAQFLRDVATGIEIWAQRIDDAVNVLTPLSLGGDGGGSYWDAVRARSILQGLGDPNGGE